MNGYITVQEAAEKWNLTTRRVQVLCSEGRILGATKYASIWIIPEDAEKPKDKRLERK
ncbi:DNA-binding protein [Clostridium sp. 19966]|uniref:DNA-binding protein n=1 Tax=Clostridium sp. 19966 TaxID=2768166 RepID=UPI0028DDF87A|nr:DNA-binding protein [Clostridium sp. 19966]MDT8716034.1 DNA-binding protein [Clostridium sp. 19966]